MKKLAYSFIALSLMLSVFTACKTDDEIEYTSDCYIKSFVLGGLTRTIYSTTSNGQDTSYNVAISGSAFPMTISHANGYIKNAIPLPSNTQLKAITASITAQGMVVYAPEADTAAWTAYASKDSIDFSQPLIFRVIATDGASFRDYRVSLSTRENDADSYTWTNLGKVADLEAVEQLKLLSMGSVPTILCKDADGQCFFYSSAAMPATRQACEGLPATADLSSAVTFNGALWMSSTDGRIYTSDDAQLWREVAQTEALKFSIVAASPSALFAITQENDGQQIQTSPDGKTWTTMATEQMLNGDAVAGVTFTQANGNKRVLLALSQGESSTLDIWGLLEDYEHTWTLFSDDELNTLLLPNASPTSIIAYNNQLIAFSKDKTLLSSDYGITWKSENSPELPSGIGTVTSAATLGKYIYLLSGNNLWQGYLNDIDE